MGTLSTHVLDTARGRPAAGIRVGLETRGGEDLAQGTTDADGRVASFGPDRLAPGEYLLRFASGEYFAVQGVEGFYPEVVVVFTVDADEHYHVPVLLNPFGYSTYRGS
jgi:5-hydroxyisourate hydrolase